ncbi:MAG: threonine synthase [bacterium]|nr:threonine synthase [bacterium]
MRFVSTRGECPSASLEEALLAGLAPDGGLFMPEETPRLPASFFEWLPGHPLVEIADRVAAAYLGEMAEDERRALIEDALDFEIPLVEVGEGLHVLELFHGPTLAFKDVGARFMARLMARSIRERPQRLTVLVATSGDTGSAVAHAFYGLEGIRVAILYPEGKVSRLQEKQFTTLGGNVRALAVDGDFDDCQRLVKEAFGIPGLCRELGLTSANSINVARLLPQMFYYFHAVGLLAAGAPPPVFSTPSGNFGNLTAGLMARAMGLAGGGFVAATNVNDSVPRYLESGRYQPRPARATISNAMDVGDPSNFQRMLWLFDGDLERMREVVTGSRSNDEETRAAIRDVYAERGYVLDPHTAVGYLGLRRRIATLGEAVPGIVLATAHPAKFREEIEATLGIRVELPERLARCLELPRESIRIAPRLEALEACLRA